MWCSLSLSSQSLRFFRCELLPCRKELAMTGSPGSWPSRRGPPPCPGPDSTARAELPSFWNPRGMEIYTLSIPHTFESKGPCCSLSFPCKSVFRNFTCFMVIAFEVFFQTLMSKTAWVWYLCCELLPQQNKFPSISCESGFLICSSVRPLWKKSMCGCIHLKHLQLHRIEKTTTCVVICEIDHLSPGSVYTQTLQVRGLPPAFSFLTYCLYPTPWTHDNRYPLLSAIVKDQPTGPWNTFLYHLHIHQGTFRVSESYLHSVLETCRLCDAAV